MYRYATQRSKWHLILTATLCVYFSNVSATSPCTQNCGLYFGFGGGELFTQGKLSLNQNSFFTVPVATDLNINRTRKFKLGKDSLMGTAYMGYTHPICNSEWNLGSEIFVNIINQKVTLNDFSIFEVGPVGAPFTDIVSSNEFLRTKQAEVGLDILPKWQFVRDAFMTARVGFGLKELKIKSVTSNNFLLIAGGGNTIISTTPITIKKNLLGIRLGLGFEKQICSNLSFDVNYIYTRYPHIKGTGAADITTSEGTMPRGLTNNINSSLRCQSILLRLNYYIF